MYLAQTIKTLKLPKVFVSGTDYKNFKTIKTLFIWHRVSLYEAHPIKTIKLLKLFVSETIRIIKTIKALSILHRLLELLKLFKLNVCGTD